MQLMLCLNGLQINSDNYYENDSKSILLQRLAIRLVFLYPCFRQKIAQNPQKIDLIEVSSIA